MWYFGPVIKEYDVSKGTQKWHVLKKYELKNWYYGNYLAN